MKEKAGKKQRRHLFKHLIKPSTKTSFWSWASAAAVCALQFKSSITLPDTRRRERLASTMQRMKNICMKEYQLILGKDWKTIKTGFIR